MDEQSTGIKTIFYGVILGVCWFVGHLAERIRRKR